MNKEDFEDIFKKVLNKFPYEIPDFNVKKLIELTIQEYEKRKIKLEYSETIKLIGLLAKEYILEQERKIQHHLKQ